MATLKQEEKAAIEAAIAKPSAAAKVIAKVSEAAVVEQEAIADLNQDISAAYVEAEVQAISDKVDAILVALRAAGVVAAS